jgi:hypothetical protein
MVSERESRRDSFDECPLGNKKNKGREGTEKRMRDEGGKGKDEGRERLDSICNS